MRKLILTDDYHLMIAFRRSSQKKTHHQGESTYFIISLGFYSENIEKHEICENLFLLMTII